MGERFQNVIGAPRYILRLEDVDADLVFEAKCLRCDHVKIVGPDDLRARFPGYTWVNEIEQKLRCGAYRHRGGNRLTPGRMVE